MVNGKLLRARNDHKCDNVVAQLSVDMGAIMRTMVFAMAGVIVSAVSLAQDQPRSVKTQKIQTPSLADTALYAIEADGTVKIDWNAVETLASSRADRTMSPFAEVMLAIRDNKWKPMD